MKFLIMGVLFSTQAVASFGTSCSEFQSNNVEALKITKTFNRPNELVIRVSVDKNCKINPKRPIIVYWEMGKKQSGGKIPCEKPLLKEVREFFGYNDLEDMYKRSVVSSHDHKIVAQMPALSKFPSRVGSSTRLSDHITFESFKASNGCKIKTKLEVNSRVVEVTRIHNIIKFLSLKRIELYKQNTLIKKL